MAPTRGTSVGVTIAEAAHEVGSDDDLLRIDAWFNTHQPLGPFIVHTGGRFAAVAGLHDPSDVPLTEQLYFGASSDIRGFGFGDGPGAYSPGNVRGTWRTSLELPISRGISVHGFWDAGGIFDWSGRGTIAQRSAPACCGVRRSAVPFVGEGPRRLLGIGQTFDET
jgi:outer membrane protein assembly factor BamA